MAAFPTIYLHPTGTAILRPVVGVFTDTMAHDPAIRSQTEGGYITSRARFTRISRQWTVRYEWMSNTARTGNPDISQKNKDVLKTFEDAPCAGSQSFTWTNPADGANYTVRFLGPVRYTPHPHTNFLWWTVEFELEQV